MFCLPEMKSFKDSVHGYINIPKIFVTEIIDTPEFQRLRNIEQTGMKVLYPAAKHDRFIHSLGVFHLGSIAVDALMDNFREDTHWKIRSDRTREVFWAKNKVLFLIACLLHDIGHAPFSHSLEQFFGFELDRERNEKLFQMLIQGTTTEAEIGYFNKSSEHERMSAWLVLDENCPWRDRIKNLLVALREHKFPERFVDSDGEYDNEPSYIDIDDIQRDIQFIARMILGVKYSDYKPESQIRNCFIELLNGSFDVDKLDYTVRDTRMSGISNITIDIERLLGSLTIIPKTIYVNNSFDLDADEFNQAIITKMDCDGSHVLLVKAKLDKELTIGTISDDPNDKCIITFPKGTKLKLKPNKPSVQGGIETSGGRVNKDYGATSNDKPPIIIADDKHHAPIDGELSVPRGNNMRLELDVCVECDSFKISISSEQKYNLSIDSANASAPVRIERGHILPPKSVRFFGKIKGFAKSLEVLKDELVVKDKPPSKNQYTGFSLGFNKQAVNIVSNVVDARNYLYLWIYSHHKVIYYANYLIPELSRLSIQSVSGEPIRKKMICILDGKDENEKPYMLDDSFILSQIRDASKKNSVNGYYNLLFQEFLSRRYRISLYKSLAEFDLIFSQFDDEKRIKIKTELEKISLLFPLSDEKNPALSDEDPIQRQDQDMLITILKYGCIKSCELSEMIWGEFRVSDIVDDLVWVSVNPSLKRPDASTVFISFGREETSLITTIDRLPLLSLDELKVEQGYYFYLYYREKSSEELEKIDVKPKDTKRIITGAFIEFIKKRI